MKRGFSLLECVVATFVLMGGFLAVLSAFTSSQRAAALDRNRMTAAAIARGILEDARACPYGDATRVAARLQRWQRDETVTHTIEGQPVATTFRKTVQLATRGFSGATSASNDTLTVTVRWREGTAAGGAGRETSLTLSGSVVRDE